MMLFICVMLWNNWVIVVGEITDDDSVCRKVTEVLSKTMGRKMI